MSQLDKGKTPRQEPIMSEASIVANSQPDENPQLEDEADSFVAREASRRKRLLRFYLILLAVPVALAIAVLIFGRSDRQVVMETIEREAPAIVQEEVGNQVQPAINAEVKNQIAPTLNEIKGLEQKTDMLSNSQKEIEVSLRNEAQSLRSKIDDKANTVSVETQAKINRLEADSIRKLTAIENKIRALEDRINKLPKSGRLIDDQILKPIEPKKSPQ